MLHASNLSRNVAKSRGLFYFSCNSQQLQLQNRVLHVNFFLQLATQRLLRCKLLENLLRVTWPLIKLTRRASCSLESMQSGTEILVCWMLVKCSLKALEISTGLLICSPFTSIKETLVGLG